MRRSVLALACLAACLALAPAAPAAARSGREASAAQAPAPARAKARAPAPAGRQRGEASVYAARLHGRTMANGAPFDRRSASAAHRTLALGTRARVRNLENGRTTLVTIHDRGPRPRARVIDLSPRSAARLGIHPRGSARVEVTPLGRGRG